VTRLGYTIYVGGDAASGRLAEAIGRVADDDVETAVSGVVGTWEVLRRPGERLADTLARVGGDGFAAHVSSIASGFEAGAEASSPAPTSEPARSPATAA
jgi:sulfite reductase beta subunit-like hemoprotein